LFFFFFQAEDGIRDRNVTGVQTCALPIYFTTRLNQLDSCAVSDAMDKLGLHGVVTGIHQYSTGRKIAGRVITVKLGIDDGRATADRKSTRLNSSHVSISYAVFCLKKKKSR